MSQATRRLRLDELITIKLQELFEQHGFQRVRVGKFEDYSLYIDNKNFIGTESMITFMDLSGKLLALKPDVTLSVAKNVSSRTLNTTAKLYYVDEVCRLSKENREYKMHNQIGIECIGPVDDFANLEVVDLALASLNTISSEFIFDLSHLGFISGLLAEMSLSHRVERKILDYIHQKNTHDLLQTLITANVAEKYQQHIISLITLQGGLMDSLTKAKQLICNEQMQQAFTELEQVAELLQSSNNIERVNLDFSVVNDLDYYNGLIFRGYVQGVPIQMLTGGRYDHLMKKMSKKNNAIGFAICLDEINTYLKNRQYQMFDILITYPEKCDFISLLQLRRDLCEKGQTVRLERKDANLETADFRYQQHYDFQQGKLIEVKGENRC